MVKGLDHCVISLKIIKKSSRVSKNTYLSSYDFNERKKKISGWRKKKKILVSTGQSQALEPGGRNYWYISKLVYNTFIKII